MEDEQIIDPVEQIEPPEPEASELADQEAEPAPAEEAEPTPEPAKPKENRVQARIDEITREKYAAKQEAEYWKKVATGEIKPPVQEAPKVAEAIPNLPPEPNQDDYPDWNEYNKALAIWGGKVALAEKEHHEKVSKQQEARNASFQNYAEREKVAKTRYPDFDEVIALAPEITFNNTTFDAILESDASADLKYYFSAKPEEAARINALNPVQQIKEIAKLEGKFATTPPQPVRRTTQAPAPINAISGAGSEVVDIDKLEGEEWLKAEKARLAKLGRRY